MSTSVNSVTNHFPSAENGFSTTTSNSVSSGATTVELNSLAGYEDGEVVEYSTWLIKQRCEEMGLNFVPVLAQFIITEDTNLDEIVNELSDGVDPIGLTHIREGVVLRIENRSKFTAYKHKNFTFKVLESIIKDAGTSDMEEDESLK